MAVMSGVSGGRAGLFYACIGTGDHDVSPLGQLSTASNLHKCY